MNGLSIYIISHHERSPPPASNAPAEDKEKTRGTDAIVVQGDWVIVDVGRRKGSWWWERRTLMFYQGNNFNICWAQRNQALRNHHRRVRSLRLQRSAQVVVIVNAEELRLNTRAGLLLLHLSASHLSTSDPESRVFFTDLTPSRLAGHGGRGAKLASGGEGNDRLHPAVLFIGPVSMLLSHPDQCPHWHLRVIARARAWMWRVVVDVEIM